MRALLAVALVLSVAWGRRLSALVPRSFDLYTNDTVTSLLEVSTSNTGTYDCGSYGDTHISTFDGIPRKYVDVMGTGEWSIVEGPDPTGTSKKWDVQGIQRVWNGCGKVAADVTVLKDVAIQCGNFYILASSPNSTAHCVGSLYPANHPLPTRVFLKGVDKNNVVYDGRDYVGTRARGQIDLDNDGNSIIFDTVSGPTSISITSTLLKMFVKCQDTISEILVYQHEHWYGGSFINLQVKVPFDTTQPVPMKPIRCGGSPTLNTMKGGYCGCWNKADDDAKKLTDNWNTCANRWRPFYDPGTETLCDETFKVPPSKSLFSRFQYWTTNLFNERNDPHFVFSGSSTLLTDAEAAKLLPFDPIVSEEKRRQCKVIAVAALGHSINWADTGVDPRVLSLNATAEACREDMLNGLPWSNEIMLTKICEDFAFQIENERKDVYCAYQKLDAEMERITPLEGDYLEDISNLKSSVDVDRIKKRNNELTDMLEEVQSSIRNIVFWYEGNCRTKTPATTNLDQVDCSRHKFLDTSTLFCPKYPPGHNTVWSTTCNPQSPNGATCNIQCSSTSSRFPPTSVNAVSATCTVMQVDGQVSAKWVQTANIACCKGDCPGVTRFRLNQCENGDFLCQDCPVGEIKNTNNDGCVERICPANSTPGGGSTRTCNCNVGYSGTITWSASTGTWTGTCSPVNCPVNSDNWPNCRCKAGFAGTINFANQAYVGTCSSCVSGANYAINAGQATCTACTLCTSVQQEVLACTPTQNRVCACSPGYQGTDAICTACVAGATYSPVVGGNCIACTRCNSEYEIVQKECTTTSNTVCVCKTNSGDACGKKFPQVHF